MKRFDFLQKHSLVAIFIFLYALHLLGVLGFVSYFEWGTGYPLLTDNYAVRSALFAETFSIFKASYRFWAYSPYHMAGWPYSFTALGSNFDELLSIALPFIHPYELLKTFVFMILFTSPLFIYLSARILKMGEGEALLYLFLSMLFFWKYPVISSARWGSPTQISGACFGLLGFSCLIRYFTEKSIKYLTLFSLAWVVGAFMYPLSILCFLLSGLVAWALYFPSLRLREHLKFLLALTVTFCLNLIWIVPILQFLFLIEPMQSYPYFLQSVSFWKWYFRRDLSYLLVLVLGIAGLFLAGKSQWKFALILATGIFFNFFYLHFSSWPLALVVQRYRYSWPLFLLLLIPTTHLVQKSLSDASQMIKKGPSPMSNRTSFISVFVGITLVLSVGTNDFGRYVLCVKRLSEKERTFETSHPLPTSFAPQEMKRLIHWIRDETTNKGRILMQDASHPNHIYWGSHLIALIPTLTQREVMGSLVPELEVLHTFATFKDEILFGERLSEMPKERFLQYLKLYNIGWIVCYTREANDYLASLSPHYVEKKGEFYPFVAYLVRQPLTFFYKGQGECEANYDRIRLRDVKPEGGKVILKYHWFPRLKTIPSRPIRKVQLLNDPIGFIEVDDPPPQFEIVNPSWALKK